MLLNHMFKPIQTILILTGEFDPFTLKVIIDNGGLIFTILLFVFCIGYFLFTWFLKQKVLIPLTSFVYSKAIFCDYNGDCV